MTKLARRYNLKGPEAVPNQRGESIGRKARLSKQVALELDKALQGVAPDGGLWTAPKVVRWIKERTGEEVNKTTAWRWMLKLGFSLQVPRPRHRKKASPEQQEAFKKNWLKRLPT